MAGPVCVRPWQAEVVAGASDGEHFALARLHVPDIDREAAVEHRSGNVIVQAKAAIMSYSSPRKALCWREENNLAKYWL